MSKKGRRRRDTPGMFSAAGLVRYYEESDVGVKLKPHVLVALMVAFTVAVIVLSKVAPP
ncbi:preprotein translocase subunit Sec61beta [Desulfurococcus mucosus]|uniref:Preprotein translocase subunit SecG n=1 Tax=Desulfurococcus mucosus (strain ATCC 35584 / DSM 2162 / JCM 9187 / O7/1) TaxID=765177 RepID=E8RAQ4_DESM0|nr:preprotein translocase subunit Sec61beta [Desulfurococcus mucosus]ADV65490.1 Sec61_beta domain containing protein [Desulfurococcus mucosus DSM 2162]